MKIHSPGTLINQYEIASRPMMGGMGIVYICLDRETDRPVALKTFRPEYLPDRAARDRFLREGTHWVDLGAHPHVVRCYDVLYIDPEVYLVLELIAKEQGREDASLRSWLTPGHPLPVEQSLLFALQIARGMAYAVATIPGFVHRDLKPENVLVGADRLSGAGVNRVRVTDFGLVKIVNEAGASLSLDEVEKADLNQVQFTRGAGTPLYMAPEQWRGEPVTVATDVYAVGCILYEMVAGQRAMEGRNLAALERAHCQGQARPWPTDVLDAIAGLVSRCLTREPAVRYGRWEKLEAALGAAYSAVVGRPAPLPEPAQALERADRVAAGSAHNALGRSYLDIGKPSLALGYFKRALVAGRTERERGLQGAGLTNLAVAHLDLGDARLSMGYLKQALVIVREIGNRWGEGQVLANRGNAYLQLGDSQQAIRYYEQWLSICRETGDRRGEGQVLNNLGIGYRQLGDARRAAAYHEQALVIFREVNDRRAEGQVMGNLGIAYRILGDTQRAIDCYEQNLVIAREVGDRHGEGSALGNLGIAYGQLGDSQRATGYLERALAIFREVGDRRGEGTSLTNLGNAYTDLGDTQRAIGYFEQALAIHRQLGDILTAAMTSAGLAQTLAGLGRLEEAVSLTEQAVRDFRQAGYPQHAQRAQQLVEQLRATLR